MIGRDGTESGNSSVVEETSPARDSLSPDSSSSEENHDRFEDGDDSDDEIHEILRHQRLYSRRGSMPEREIDAEDAETAELQTTLRKYSSRTKLQRSEDESIDASDGDCNNRRRDRRGGSNPEREINEDDTETAAFQSNLRKLNAAKLKNRLSQSSPQLVNLHLDEVIEEVGDESDKPPEKKMAGSRNKTIFRPSAMKAGRGRGGLRRSRTWEGFSSGLRYESVSDAGMPPPPPAPPTQTFSNHTSGVSSKRSVISIISFNIFLQI